MVMMLGLSLFSLLLISSTVMEGLRASRETLESQGELEEGKLSDTADVLHCPSNTAYVWCLPQNYNPQEHPFLYSSLVNRSLPWNYDFTFVVEEVTDINDKEQTMSISMYFGVSWLDPRLRVNESSTEWSEAGTAPVNEVNVSPSVLRHMWYPELEIYGLERFGRQRVLKEMSGVRIRKNLTIHYELGVRITVSCRMMFDDYPLDEHHCLFQVGSYYDTSKTVQCTSDFVHFESRQRSLQHAIRFEPLPKANMSIDLPSGNYAACGFQVGLRRNRMQFLIQVYLPSSLFVVVSWVSFLIRPDVVPGRMALLVTLFLVLINIFNSVSTRAPTSARLNALDLYLVVCIFIVFGALVEYAVILFILKRQRRSLNKRPPSLEAKKTGPPLNTQGEGEQHMMSELAVEREETMFLPTSSQQPIDSLAALRTEQLCDTVDTWAMCLSPVIFIGFNLVYWVAYKHPGQSIL